MTLHVTVSGEGPPVVLLHGFTGSTETWERFRPALERNYRVIAVDHLGHGLSSSPADPQRYRLVHFGTDLTTVVDSLGISSIVILGYSMGGRAALRFVMDHAARVSGLVLESTSAGIPDPDARRERRRSDSALADEIERDGIASFVKRWESLSLWDTQAVLSVQTRERLRNQRLANSARGLANSLRGAGAAEDSLLIEAATSIRVPALVIAGGLDEKYSDLARELGRAIPGARAEIVANAGHTVHLERPEAFLAALTDFLAQIPSSGSNWT